MRARTLAGLLAIATLGALVWGFTVWKRQPPEVQFTRVAREPIHSAVATNGKVEPIESASARAERSGPVQRIWIQRGQSVKKDAALVDLDATDARADLAAAQARIAQSRADIEVMDRGGRATDLVEISSGLDRARLDLETAQKDYDALHRLEQKQAATRTEVLAAKDKVDRAQLQIQALERRRAALAAGPDRPAAVARLQEAQAASALAQRRIDTSVVRSPIDGVVYQFDLKPGAYLNAGDTVAWMGRLDRVRVNVYVDEPDLGRVEKGMPAIITWDGLPGRQWSGEVDRTPTQVVALGTRQVGEVACAIMNPDRDLLPGTNVNVEIRARSAGDALTVPKEALRTQSGQTGVYVLEGDHVVWKKVTLGVANTTRTQVEGLNQGDAVALGSDRPLKNGMPVTPVFP